MALRDSRGYQVGLWGLTLACLGGAGFLAYKTFFSSGSTTEQLASAEKAFTTGSEAYKGKNWGEAATRFDEAKILADKAAESLQSQLKSKAVTDDEAKDLQAKIMWIKARALRDQAYAKAQTDGKPLPDVPDPQYNETFRMFGAIPDDEARNDAVNALRTAVKFSADPEVMKEALRFELVQSPIQWNVAETILRKALEQNPKDQRVNFYLARFEFEQPGDDNATPTPAHLRNQERIDRSRDYLKAAKENGIPFWRAVGLEAEVLNWPVRTAEARKARPESVAPAEIAVDEFLFSPQNGMIAAAGRGDKLAGASSVDVRGLSSLLAVGFDRGAADARKPGGNAERLRSVVQAGLDLSNKMAADPTLKDLLPEIAARTMAVATASRNILAPADPAGWRLITGEIDSLLAQNPTALDTHPESRMQLAELAFTDAGLAAKAGNQGEAKDLRNRAIEQAKMGLKAAQELKLPTIRQDEFHALLAEWQMQAGGKPEEIEPHLARLRTSAAPRAKLVGQLLDARLAERQGRLEQAKKLLAPVAGDRTNPDIAFQANALLAGIALGTGDVATALGRLRELEAKYNSPDLPLAARAWADQMFGGPDGIAGSLVATNLGSAVQVANRFARENPGKPIPSELIAGYEGAADTLLKKLRPPSAGDRMGRLAAASYLLGTGRAKEAEGRLEALATDYPDSIEVLRNRCQLLAAPTEAGGPANANGIAAADLLIRKFLRDYPSDKAGRLFNAEWLLRTGRADRAVEYLTNPETFPGGRDAAVDRVLAAALFRAGQREEAQKILSALPPDQGIDAVLIQAATTREGGEKRLQEAMSRYEDQGLFRVYDAALRLSEQKYEDAVRGFASAVEFTRVSSAARRGLQQALLAYAEAEPTKARTEAIRVSVDMPDEPGVYLATALASLIMEDIGKIDDKWDQTKTMYAAINSWEAASLKGGAKPADIAVAKSQFRLLAGDTDGAKREAANSLNRYPDHVPSMILLAELNLMPPADPARAKELLATATKQNANDPRLPFLEAATLLAANDYAGAAAVYERIIGNSPGNPAAFPSLISSLESSDQKDAALKWAKTWAERFPNDARAATETIRLLIATGKKDDATKMANELIERKVEDIRKRIADAKPPLEPAVADKAVAETRASWQLVAASGFFRAGSYDEAETFIREVRKTHPKSDRAILMLGDIALSRKKWDEATPLYEELLKENPRHFIAGNNLAWVLAEMKNEPAKALAIVEEVRKGKAGDRPIGAERLPPDFLDTIGVIYLKLNKPEVFREMRNVFEAAVKRYPSDPRMALYLAHALAATGERSRALSMFDTATRLASTKNGISAEQNKTVIDAAEAARQKLRN